MMSQDKIDLLNYYVKVDVLLRKYWMDFSNDQNVVCPFHEDSSPSAHIYDDVDGQSLHCFTEGRNYKAYDVMLLFGVDPEKVYQRIISKFGERRPELKKPEKELIIDSFPSMNGITIENWCRGVRLIYDEYVRKNVGEENRVNGV